MPSTRNDNPVSNGCYFSRITVTTQWGLVSDLMFINQEEGGYEGSVSDSATLDSGTTAVCTPVWASLSSAHDIAILTG